MVLAENVGGLLQANEGRAFDKILTEFMEAGYAITPNLYKNLRNMDYPRPGIELLL